MSYKIKETVAFKKGQLGNYAVILEGIPARGSQSRLRTRFVKKLSELLNSANEEITESLKDNANFDEDGKVEMNEEGTSPQYLSEEHKETHLATVVDIMNEEVFFTGLNDKKMLEAVGAVLETSNVEYSGVNAVIYDSLCDAVFEEAED